MLFGKIDEGSVPFRLTAHNEIMGFRCGNRVPRRAADPLSGIAFGRCGKSI